MRPKTTGIGSPPSDPLVSLEKGSPSPPGDPFS